MPDEKKIPKSEVKVEIPKKEFESTYTIAELMDASEYFKTTRIVVKAALSRAGKEAYTLNEAKRIIETMKNKEVRA